MFSLLLWERAEIKNASSYFSLFVWLRTRRESRFVSDQTDFIEHGNIRRLEHLIFCTSFKSNFILLRFKIIYVQVRKKNSICVLMCSNIQDDENMRILKNLNQLQDQVLVMTSSADSARVMKLSYIFYFRVSLVFEKPKKRTNVSFCDNENIDCVQIVFWRSPIKNRFLVTIRRLKEKFTQKNVNPVINGTAENRI